MILASFGSCLVKGWILAYSFTRLLNYFDLKVLGWIESYRRN